MDLPQQPFLPPLANYGYPLLTTQAFQTTHRSAYGHTPRIFPALLRSYQVQVPEPWSQVVDGQRDGTTLSSGVGQLESDTVGSQWPHGGDFIPSSFVASARASEAAFRSPQESIEVSPSDGRQPIFGSINGVRIVVGYTGGTTASSFGDIIARRSLLQKSASLVPKRRSQNTAASVSWGDTSFAVLCPGGVLERACLYSVRRGDENMRVVSLGLASNHGKVPAFCGAGRVFCQDAFSSDGMSTEPSRVAFGTSKGIYVADVDASPRLSWCACASVNGLLSFGFSRTCPSEVLALYEDGLRLCDLESASSDDMLSEYDVWPLKVEYKLFKAGFGAHPRVALLASQAGMHRVDLRGKVCAEDVARNMLFDVRKDWRVSPADGGLRVYEPHPRVPFLMYAASEERLTVVDERMPKDPMAAWSLVYSGAPSTVISCASAVKHNSSEYGEVLALGYPRDASMAVFHTHGPRSGAQGAVDTARAGTGPGASVLGLGTASSGTVSSGILDRRLSSVPRRRQSRAPAKGSFSHTFPEAPVQWSDMPLCHLDTYAPSADCLGIALIPHSREQLFPYHDAQRSPQAGGCFSVVQVSRSGGVIAQLVGCNAFEDGERAFEADDEASSFGACRDSFIALRDTQLRFHDARTRKRILDGVNGGVRVLRMMKRLHSVSALDLQLRISSREHDERSGEHAESSSLGPRAPTLSRPSVSDRPLVVRLNGDQSSQECRDDSGPGFDPNFLKQFLVVPRTFSEVAESLRVGKPHCATPLSPDALLELLLSSPCISSYECRCPLLSDDSTAPSTTVFEWKEAGMGEGDNDLTSPVEGTPFAALLTELDDIFTNVDKMTF